MTEAPPITSATWRDYARLAHLEMVGLWLVPLIGGFIARGPALDLRQIILLYFVNTLFVSLGFIHNDIVDAHVDRLSTVVSSRPIASGRIAPRQAWTAIYLCMACLALIAGVFFRRPLPIAMLVLAVSFAMLYNRFGKSFLGADVLYAISASFLLLFGALAASPPGTSLAGLPHLVWPVLVIIFANHLYFNAIPGGLKDLQNDRNAALKTLAVRYSTEGPGGLAVKPAFKILAIGIKLMAALSILAPIFFFGYKIACWRTLILLLGCIRMVMLSNNLVSSPGLKRSDIEIYTKKEEMLSGFVLWLLIADVAGLRGAIILAVAPVLWFFPVNYLVNGKTVDLPKTF